MAFPGDLEVTGSPDRAGRDEKIWKITPLSSMKSTSSEEYAVTMLWLIIFAAG